MRILAVLAGAAVASFAVSQANAAIVDIVWTGTVLDGTDTLGLFGAAGASLADVSYSANYRFDTSTTDPAQPGEEDTRGGAFNSGTDGPSPLVGASITINGVSVDVLQGFFDDYLRRSRSDSSIIFTEAEGQTGANNFTNILFNRASRSDNGYPFGLDTAFALIFGADDTTDGLFQRSNADGTAFFQAHLRPTSVTVSLANVAQTPLPAAIALFPLGLAGLGLSRRRKLA